MSPNAIVAPSLRRSLGIQFRVIGALLMREVITRFGRSNLGVLWLLGEPILFTLGVATLWSGAGLHASAIVPIVAFAITGYSSVLMWRNAVSSCVSAIQQNINLLYHRNVLVIDVFLARIILEFCGATGSFIVLTLVFMGAEWIAPPVDPLGVVLAWAMLTWFGASLAILVGAATAFSDLIKRLWSPISYLLFPLSGAAFMVDWLPPKGQDVVLLLPMVHGVEYLRESFFGRGIVAHYDLAYMAAVNLTLLFLGLMLLAMAARRVEAE